MKCLFLAPRKYPFIHSIEAGIRANNIEVKTVDYEDFFSKRTNKLIKRFTNLPNRMKSPWEKPYERKINQSYLKIFKEYRPDLVLVYNNQLAHPDFFDYIKGKTKIAFILGDHPLYTRTSMTNLHILYYADYVVSPDSMWQEQLSRMGVRNVVLDFLGFSEDIYYPMEVSEDDRQKYQSEFIFVGSASKINWGYKRILFLNLFKDYDLKAYFSGDGMERWLKYFPDLKDCIIPHDRFDPGFNNLVYNCSKIAPMEQVPSLFNGIHARVFDVLGAGILPLCEYSADMHRVFEGIDVPLIHNYEEAPELAEYWLNNDDKRADIVRKMRDRASERYAPALLIQRMAAFLFKEMQSLTPVKGKVGG
jgi:hypothetical protein